MTNSGLINFSDARSLSPSAANATRDIRRMISEAFMDDDFFQSIGKHLMEPGSAGNRQMDQALIAEAVFNKQPILKSYDNLNHKALWGHIVYVLTTYGYDVRGGRVAGHRLEYKASTEDETAVSAA